MPTAEGFVTARDFLIAHRTDYAAAVAGYAPPRSEHFNWALDFFDPQALGNEAPALTIVGDAGTVESFTFEEMRVRSNRAANFLRALGVRRGERILLMLPNVLPLWDLTLAAIKLGAVVSPATTLLRHADLEDRIERGNIRHVVADASGVEKLNAFPFLVSRVLVGADAPGWSAYAGADACPGDLVPDGTTRADDPLLLYFTSGTTAKPKMVLHTHQSYPVGHLSTLYWLGLQAGDVHFNISSPGWAKHAYSSFFAPWSAGACIFVFNYARFDAKRVLDALVRHGVTTLCAPPTVWRMLILEDLKAYPVRLRELISAGEPLNPEVIEQVRAAWNLTIRDGYGQTETTLTIGNSPGQKVKLGSMGRPMPGFTIDLLDADGRTGDDGEISLRLDPRPTGLMVGYADSAERTRSALGGVHYRTSDTATRDADGYFWYIGRSDDVFKSSDYRISPFELESTLIECDTVAEAAVVPAPDPLRLAVPKAYVLLKPGVPPTRETALEILRFARERLAPYKRVRRIEFYDLPKTISGKIRRVQLRGTEEERAAAGARGEREFREEDFPELT